MTKKDFIRELKSYFPEIDWTPGAESRVNLLLDRYNFEVKERVVVKQVYVDREVLVEGTSAREEDCIKVAKDICEQHGITLEQLKVNSPKWAYAGGRAGTKELVDARYDFVRKIFSRFPHSSKSHVSRWLGYKDHSSIHHLLSSRKV